MTQCPKNPISTLAQQHVEIGGGALAEMLAVFFQKIVTLAPYIGL